MQQLQTGNDIGIAPYFASRTFSVTTDGGSWIAEGGGDAQRRRTITKKNYHQKKLSPARNIWFRDKRFTAGCAHHTPLFKQHLLSCNLNLQLLCTLTMTSISLEIGELTLPHPKGQMSKFQKERSRRGIWTQVYLGGSLMGVQSFH